MPIDDIIHLYNLDVNKVNENIQKFEENLSELNKKPENLESKNFSKRKDMNAWIIVADINGVILKSINTLKVFEKDDLVGSNFFELMAPYNRSYFESEYGEKILSNMRGVIRYSLNHELYEPKPLIVSSKIKPIYINNQRVGARIISRASWEESTNEFREKILMATIKANKYIKDFLSKRLSILKIQELIEKKSNLDPTTEIQNASTENLDNHKKFESPENLDK